MLRSPSASARGVSQLQSCLELHALVVFHLADRIMVLAEGAMLAEGTPDEIAKDERVQAAYLGKTE